MKYFTRKGVQPAEPWTPEADMTLVAINDEDRKKFGCPKVGDLVCTNIHDETDRWLVSKEYADQHYNEIPADVGEKAVQSARDAKAKADAEAASAENILEPAPQQDS